MRILKTIKTVTTTTTTAAATISPTIYGMSEKKCMYSWLEAITTRKEIAKLTMNKQEKKMKKKKKPQSHRVIPSKRNYTVVDYKLILNHENDKPERINFVVKLENVPSNWWYGGTVNSIISVRIERIIIMATFGRIGASRKEERKHILTAHIQTVVGRFGHRRMSTFQFLCLVRIC